MAEYTENLDLILPDKKETYDVETANTNNKGYSAYEIAVQNGYIGTVEDWIISLKGEKGDTGPIGATSLHKKIILEKRKLVYK